MWQMNIQQGDAEGKWKMGNGENGENGVAWPKRNICDIKFAIKLNFICTFIQNTTKYAPARKSC